MNDYRKEINEETYRMWTEKRANAHTPDERDAVELERFGRAICCGYGLYGWNLYECNGKFYETYEIGSTCD